MRSSYTSNFAAFSTDQLKSCRNKNATHIIIGKKQSSESIRGIIQTPILNIKSAMSATQPKPLFFGDGIDMPFTRKKNQVSKALQEENEELKSECKNLE